ncbi:MAG: SurA N-terminal domain-containing protein [Xanthobacteraceae bacterium]|nr:SurA N-terminal domain-containing protein [Xanthobacteraceae bacterium]
MLRGIRNATSNWFGKIIMSLVMGVLIVSFGIWGIGDIFRGFGQSTLAKVGKTEISTEQFRQIYTDRLQQISRQIGRPLSPDQARAFGLDRQVLQQVIAETTLDEAARKLGLQQSNEQIMASITSDPAFKGAGGAFDPVRFAQLIRQANYTEQRYIAERRQIALRRQLAGSLSGELEPSQTALAALNQFQNELRTVEFVRLEAAQAGTIDAPTPEALASFFEAHKAQFRAPEYRKIAFVAITPDELAKWMTISDDDARKVYEERKDSFATPEKREVWQMVFRNAEDAASARARLTGGMSFDDLAKERGLKPSDVDLGLVAKSAIIDPKVADAAFALKTGEISEPIQGTFGTVLVKVGKIEPGSQASFESVAPTLKREIAQERAQKSVKELHDKLEDERAGGASVSEAAEKLKLPVVTIEAIDRSGRAPDGKPVATIPPGLDLVAQAFASDVGVDNETISYRGGYVSFDVLGVTPSRERTLDEVKDQVEARWRADQIAERLRAKATEMVERLGKGAKLADEAAAIGLKVETAEKFKRDATVANLPAGAVAAAFRTAKGLAGQSEGASATERVVFRVTDIVEPTLDPASEEAKNLKASIERAVADELLGQYVVRMENEIGVTINQPAVAQITGANN